MKYTSKEIGALIRNTRELLKSAPRGWEEKNMQAVLRIRVVGFSPVSVDLVDSRYW